MDEVIVSEREEGQKKAHHSTHTEMHKQRKEDIFIKLTAIVCKGTRNFNSIV